MRSEQAKSMLVNRLGAVSLCRALRDNTYESWRKFRDVSVWKIVSIL